ncbi:glycoside hydrolase family 16 protein [Marinilabilia rubra]|uniref:glycoside hydrolase family 16 protein n=1 Tax=Marinilabilia rubra TaxID=2162893 RepID=UPI0018E09EC3|nr:glycoside hydrolase family 16 protein [Marinilabilia rubra]
MISWKNLLLFIWFGVPLLTVGCTETDKDNYELVWSEEFDYTGLPDETKWNYDTIGNSYGWGNNELQCYTVGRKKNAYVDGENLVITARKEAWDDFNYTSARLTTKEKGDWLYGRMEIKANIPGGRGIWPAIWMLPTDWAYGGWPESGEIDIMEHVGYESDSIYTTVHTGAYNHAIGTEVGKATFVPHCEGAFCVYAIEWKKDKIDFFIDDEKVFTFDKHKGGTDVWPFDKRFHLILNVAVGGHWGGLHGVDDDIFPAKMLVDYVRVYKFLE